MQQKQPMIVSKLEIFQKKLAALVTDQSTQANQTYLKDLALNLEETKVYYDLIDFTSHSVLSSIYPVCRLIFGEPEWSNVLHAYLQMYPPQHFHLNKIAEQFSLFLKRTESNRPWLCEIADYEYLELEIEEVEADSISENTSFDSLDSNLRLSTYSPVINRTFCRRTFNYDVVTFCKKVLQTKNYFCEPDAAITELVFYRDPESDLCRVLQLGSQAQCLFDLAVAEVPAKQMTYIELMQATLTITGSSNIEEALVQLLSILDSFHQSQLFVGNKIIRI